MRKKKCLCCVTFHCVEFCTTACHSNCEHTAGTSFHFTDANKSSLQNCVTYSFVFLLPHIRQFYCSRPWNGYPSSVEQILWKTYNRVFRLGVAVNPNTRLPFFLTISPVRWKGCHSFELTVTPNLNLWLLAFPDFASTYFVAPCNSNAKNNFYFFFYRTWESCSWAEIWSRKAAFFKNLSLHVGDL